jgi:hypothetical protein
MIEAGAPVSPKNRIGISFRLALPLGQLVLCALILWPTRGYIFNELGLPEWTQGTPLLIRFGGPTMAAFACWSRQSGMHTVIAINLPAAVFHVPYAIFSTSHQVWTPGHVDARVWQAITYPILGLVFWWVAGRGADALMAAARKQLAPKIRWTETIIGFLLAAGGAVVVLAFVFGGGEDRNKEEFQILAALAGMWAGLGALTAAARFVQWRMREALSRRTPPRSR